MTPVAASSFPRLYGHLDHFFFHHAHKVQTERWQGKETNGAPDLATYELLNVGIAVPLNGITSLEHWQNEVQPNLPWADEHFDERVCGEPLNPTPSYKRWPWGNSAEKFINDDGQFNHTYPERLWPKYAGMTDKGELSHTIFDPARNYQRIEIAFEKVHPRLGIRHTYGDLEDVVALLARDPLTRQAWIPLFFPEDTGIGDGGRKPCTLGYQFIMRDNRLHIYYPLRSCDYAHHFRDDIYLAIRLLLWVLERCQELNETWRDVLPGTYTMHATSLHLFANDYHRLVEKQKPVAADVQCVSQSSHFRKKEPWGKRRI